MNIIVTGGAGFIGHHLVSALLERHHRVTVFDHKPPRLNVDFVKLDLAGQLLPAEFFKDVDAIFHLAGRNIFARWNEKVKNEVYNSRIRSTRGLVASLAGLEHRPRVLVSASAVGYYGNRGEEELNESSSSGDDFPARLCVDWEAEARQAEHLGLRTVQVRTAPVLGNGGMLAQLAPLYKWYLGGPLGSGRQWFPWIHVQDIVGVYLLSLENESINGPVNACSPGLIRNRDFSRALARVLRRPSLVRVPQWGFRLVYKGLADFILASLKVVPQKVTGAGYRFEFADINEALANLLISKTKSAA